MLQLAEVVLRHGLVHPMSCIAMLVAMQVCRALSGCPALKPSLLDLDRYREPCAF